MKRTSVFCMLLAALTAGICWGMANRTAAPAPEQNGGLFDYRQITLDNGLTVITLEDFSCPIVSVQVWYKVGSKDERPDRQGYAHMFEHMMFKGTDRVSEKDHFELIRRAGGVCNAYTSYDQTVYFETLPADQIELALWLEAERMSFLKIDQNAFDTERKVVEEELRMRQNQPYGNVFKKIVASVFSVHPYRWTPIGNLAHLRATSVADLRRFWMTYYVPNNATLIITGAIRHQDAQELAQRYFGWIAPGQTPPQVAVQEPQPEAKTVVIDDENAPAGQVMMVWRTVPAGSRDETVLDFLSQILGTGFSSRLYRTLVAETQAAVEANTWTYNLQQDGLFAAEATLKPDSQDYDGLLDALDKQIELVRTGSISDAELEKARNQLLKELVTSNLEVESKAAMLGRAAVTIGDTSRINTLMAEIRSVTKEDIQRAAQQYLTPQRGVRFIIRQNQGMERASKDDETAAVTAEPELTAPAPGRPGLQRPASFPATPPLVVKTAAAFDISCQRARLSNGLEIRVIPNHEVPFVSVMLGLTSGAWTDDKPGTASMTLAMLTRGTARRTEGQLAADLEQYGITLTGQAEMDTATVSMNCLSEHLERGMSLLSETVLEPAFDPAEFSKLMQQRMTELAVRQQQPEYLANKYFRQALFGSHPYARPAEGSVADLQQLGTDDLKKWWSSFARPEEAVLIFAGDVTKTQAAALAQRYLGSWRAAGAATRIELPAVPTPQSTRILLVDRPGSAQAQIQVGQLGLTRRQQPDHFIALITGNYFGGAFHSRLMDNLRVQRGLTYDARGGWRAQNLAGTFEASTFTRNDAAAAAIQVLLEQIRSLQTAEPTDEEFNNTRSYFIGSFVIQRETPQDIARDIWLIESQKLGRDYFRKLFKTLKNATKQDCVQLARRSLDPQRLSIVVVGDAAKLKETLSGIAPVEVIVPEIGLPPENTNEQR
ncbi:MAG TPA: pitrilysin family protein [Anaerohalosphaeraceae bacterium]|nr:pitrilysin family protein [Anaerohalosphaeraceae bacterium]HOM77063.1 pitrilysin family protein [Anaerohalosphaeraceae bacterium]HPC65369.1 pitrilysin family protein [Anaerohalosphaeraceae bacterium]HPO70413.1 pitrilysin family protein [Anaerohalosphaeraceae bacterium]HRS71776.1 pitrilysin family protein [Anaerohalosphaeraceae bacterium]